MNTKDKGDIAEAFAIARLLQLGYSVSVPFGDNQRYDLIVDKGGELLKVQVKYCSIRKQVIEVPLASVYSLKNENVIRHYEKTEIDIVLVYCPDTEKLYWIDFHSIDNRYSIKLRFDKKGDNQRRVKLAEDYEF